MRVVVIGAGFGGLAAAIRLRLQGHDTVLMEQRDRAGGRASVFERGGFRFDAGPTIITAPHFIDELFALAGRRREDHVRLVPLEPFYRVRFEDGTVFACSGRPAVMEEEVARISPRDVPGYRRFVAETRRIFEQAMPLIDAPAGSLGAMLGFTPALLRARAWRSVAGLVRRHLQDERLRQALSFHPLLIGGHPFHAPAIYALIPELERRWGVWHVEGGTGALVEELVRLFEDAGGILRLRTPARDLVVDASGRASGVRVGDGDVLPADVVVSNADPGWTYRHLVPSSVRRVHHNRRLARFRYGMSVFVLYFGTDRRYDALGHHEILMGPRYRGLLDDVFRRRRLAHDVSLYVHHPTVTDPTLAPDGGDCWYALAPVPHLGAGVDWRTEGEAYRDRIVAALERRFLPGLSGHIVAEHRVDPRYFRDELNAPEGSAFSLEPVLTQSAWFRPHNASDDVPNLYLVGAGTHPGAGIPGVLSSAKIVARLVAERHGVAHRIPSLPLRALAAR